MRTTRHCSLSRAKDFPGSERPTNGWIMNILGTYHCRRTYITDHTRLGTSLFSSGRRSRTQTLRPDLDTQPLLFSSVDTHDPISHHLYVFPFLIKSACLDINERTVGWMWYPGNGLWTSRSFTYGWDRWNAITPCPIFVFLYRHQT
ncbi:hypothetical protein P152DRAFT_207082 [Eremomyces bilateralis CBS 781.70]|uniref:Uncharacterized protein n=1 Tax=Eremomyces bilateralis CBS 781.70 TaxID=1392243 RepID=A0A6G1FT33_9PEZI|nr:uncharacterized protein P152DRAFT_207082 [Eremomyces bilateralis CBS 781.70]KAF1808890.1 hypothetical protein P152DRAFT_207082 [Eremomyces bilateralis CBS 781.70]